MVTQIWGLRDFRPKHLCDWKLTSSLKFQILGAMSFSLISTFNIEMPFENMCGGEKGM